MRRTGSASSLALLHGGRCARRARPAGGRRAAVPPQPIPEGPEPSQPPAVHRRARHSRARSRRRLPPRHPFMAANGRSNIHDDAYMSRHLRGPRPARARHGAAVHLPGRRVRLGDVRPRGPDRLDLRGRRGPAPRDVRPAHAGPARRVPAAAAPAGHGEPVQRLLRRRLLLPRQPRPRRDPHHEPPHLGRGRDVRAARPRVRARARLRPERRDGRRTTSSSRCCPTGRGGCGSSRSRAWSGRSIRGSGAIRTLDLGEQVTNSFAVDETRRRLHRLRRGALPVRRDRRPARRR